MNRFSKTQIYLHWITLLFVAITYAAMELRGWFPKGSSTYLLMRETHYNAGIFVWVLMFSRLIRVEFYSNAHNKKTTKSLEVSDNHRIFAADNEYRIWNQRLETR